MSEQTGTTIRCDWRGCENTVMEPTAEEARERAERLGWTQHEDGRDFCRLCTETRADRKKAADLLPDGVVLYDPFGAADAAGWERRDYDEETGVAHFYCCGEEVEVSAIIGMPYGAKCNTCGTAIADVIGPHFKGSAVSMPDPDKVDTEDPCTWVVVQEYERAVTDAKETP